MATVKKILSEIRQVLTAPQIVTDRREMEKLSKKFDYRGCGNFHK